MPSELSDSLLNALSQAPAVVALWYLLNRRIEKLERKVEALRERLYQVRVREITGAHQLPEK